MRTISKQEKACYQIHQSPVKRLTALNLPYLSSVLFEAEKLEKKLRRI